MFFLLLVQCTLRILYSRCRV